MVRRKGKPIREANNVVLQHALSLLVVFTKKEQMGPDIGPCVVRKTLKHNEKLGSSAGFKASTGWFRNFKSLHGIREL
ncbi:hypothetical protein TNCV_3062531 [Trichonephila clavipes]|nr:hypothetical protein TNCV_3062531 [Trichonephila clavipes]